MGYPVCLIDVYGENDSYEFTGEAAPGYGPAPSSDLLSCRTDKRLSSGSPAGTFEIVLALTLDADRRTWKDKIRPQDTVVIQMMNYQARTGAHGAGEMHTVMIGLVDTISESTVLTAQGLPQRAMTVRGRDFAKLFVHGMVTYWSFAGAEILGLRAFVSAAELNAAPHEVIERLLEGLFERFTRIALNVKGTTEQIWNLLAYRLQSFGTAIPAGLDYQFLGGEGSWWNFLHKVASPPFHELFLDTRRIRDTVVGQDNPTAGVIAKTPVTPLGRDAAAPTLILRPTPFPYLAPPVTPEVTVREMSGVRVDWDALVRHEVGQDDLIGEPVERHLSVSDTEQWNVYLVFPEYVGLNSKQWLLSVAPVVDVNKFQRYGYKLYMPHTTLLKSPTTDSPFDPWVGFYRTLTWRLASWHAFNDRFESGTMTYKLLPHIHIGERLLDQSQEWTPKEYYIESVTHQFIQHERATTTLGVTRGLTPTDYKAYIELLREIGLENPIGVSEVRDAYRRVIESSQRPPS